MSRQSLLTFMGGTLLLGTVAGCGRVSEQAGPRYGPPPVRESVPVYTFAVNARYSPNKLFEAYHPLMDYLNARLQDERVVLEASRDFDAFEEKYRRRKPHFLVPNPWQTLQAMKVGYHVIATEGELEDFKGVILVHKDSGIQQPTDLKGKAISYPASTALAACIMPQYFLHQNGLDINRDVENRYVGSQESAIMNVYLGITAAGVTWLNPWRVFQRNHPREAADLKVWWETEPMISNSVMARDDVPAEVRERVRTLLVGLHETEEGKTILAGTETARYIRANDGDYDVVRAFVARFEREVRPVEAK